MMISPDPFNKTFQIFSCIRNKIVTHMLHVSTVFALIQTLIVRNLEGKVNLHTSTDFLAKILCKILNLSTPTDFVFSKFQLYYFQSFP